MQFSRMGAGPDRPYVSSVIAEGRFVCVSGQTPTRNGRLVDGLISEQTPAVLSSAGATLQEVIRCGVFLSDLTNLKDFNAAYAAAFWTRLPARTTVVGRVAGLQGGD